MPLLSYVGSSGIQPRIGDVIKINPTLDRWSIPSSFSKGKEYTVDEVFTYNASHGVKVVDDYNSLKKLSAKNFVLLKSAEFEHLLTEENTFMCILNNKIISSHPSDEAAREAAGKHIGMDFKKQVVIAQVITVAKAKMPEINFV